MKSSEKSDPRWQVGDAVRRHRLALSLSQEALADLAGLHRTYVADVERGARNLGLINIVKISRALGISPSELLKGVK